MDRSGMMRGYEEVCLVGTGAFSQVYCVRDKRTKHLYACKISRECEMLRREGELLKRLQHPLFPAYVACWSVKGLAFLVMEYIPGKRLSEIIAEQGRLTERNTLQITVCLADGLRYLHELSEPVIFRDLKPENIVIGERGRVTLLDLGSAGSVDRCSCVITGTPGYSAPEQWRKQERVGSHSDVYALGQVMLEMLSGQKTEASQFTRQRLEMLSVLEKELHYGVLRLVEECTREAVSERIPNMRCVLQRLKPYVKMNKMAVGFAERRARFCCKKTSQYSYQQNILKIGSL